MKKINRKILPFLIVGLCFVFSFLYFQKTKAETQTEGVTVNATYAGGEGTITETPALIPPPPEEEIIEEQDLTSPIISLTGVSGVGSDASISWTATDNIAVSFCNFEYGDSLSYGLSAPPGGGGGFYSVSISNLTPAVPYFFKITCFDLAGNSSISTGTFTTTENIPPTITLLTLTPTETSVYIEWRATDNVGVDSCTYVYDRDNMLEPFTFSSSVTRTLNTDRFYSYSYNLLPNTTYFYKIHCVDSSQNEAASINSFKTAKDLIPPPDVSSFTATGIDSAINLNWSYSVSVSDFKNFILKRSSSPITDSSQGQTISVITNQNTSSFTDSGLLNGVTYYYVIFVEDTTGNKSAGVFANAVPRITNEIGFCSDNLDNDLDGRVDCGDLDCAGDAACAFAEICNNNVDDDFDGLADCSDSDCSFLPICLIGAEICNDGFDNDSNGFIDCFDAQCSSDPACRILGPACSDGIDNDSDGFVDMQDPGCESPTDNEEYNPPIPTIPPEDRISTDNLFFWLAERTIETTLQDGALNSLVGDQTTIGISETALYTKPLSINLKLAGDTYKFVLNSDGWYYVDFVSPIVGNYEAYVEINYGEGLIDSVNFNLNSMPYGIVRDNTTQEILSGVEVILYDLQTGEKIWDSSVFRQVNPQNTNSAGAYAFVVPPGNYELVAKKDGYNTKRTLSFSVSNRIVNRELTLIKKPKPLIEVFDPDASFTENVQSIALNLGEKLFEQSRITSQAFDEVVIKANELADDPNVEQAVETTVAPSVVGISAAAVVPSLWTTVIPLLKFVFFQPLLLIFKKKRKKWGIVYNALSKIPIDLATVRLIDAATRKIIQSRVTDTQGRFLFSVDPGEYIFEVRKNNYVFPTDILKGRKNDDEFLDIYHGEKINVTEDNTVLTPNIPLDPIAKKEKTPLKIIWRKRLFVIQQGVSFLGVLTTIVALYITPKWYIFGFLILHLFMYFSFTKFAKPQKPKGWGIVYNKENKKPIGKAVARLFSKEFNKLIDTKLTDGKGRYAFLVGPSDYYLTFEKVGFSHTKTSDILSSEIKKEGFVAKKVAMEPASGGVISDGSTAQFENNAENSANSNDSWLNKMRQQGYKIHKTVESKTKKIKGEK